MFETLQAKLSLDDKEFKKAIDQSVNKLFDLDSSAKKVTRGLIGLSTAFGTVGGEAGKVLSTVGQLATGLAAGGPVGLAVTSIALGMGHWAEQTKKAKDEAEKLKASNLILNNSMEETNLKLKMIGSSAVNTEIALIRLKRAQDLYTLSQSESWKESLKTASDAQRKLDDLRSKWAGYIEDAASRNVSPSMPYREDQEEIKRLELILSQHDSIGKAIYDEAEAKIAYTRASKAYEKSIKEPHKGTFFSVGEGVAENLKLRREAEGKIQLTREQYYAITSSNEKALLEYRKRVEDQIAKQRADNTTNDQSITSLLDQYTNGLVSETQAILTSLETILNSDFFGFAERMLKRVGSIGDNAATLGGNVLGAVTSNPALGAASLVPLMLGVWATAIPTVLAQYTALILALIPGGKAAMAMTALVLATGLAAAALGALYLSAVQNTESYKKAQASWDRIMGHFTHGAEGLFEALNPTIYLFEIMAKHMGWFINNIATFTPASKALFEATKFLAVGILSGAIAVMTAFDFLVTSIGNTINSIISMVNVLRVPMGQDALPSVVLGGISGALLGQTEALRTELLGTSWEDARAAMDDNTEATRENTKAMERISNMPSGYRMRSTIWASQNPIVATVPLQQSITGSLGGLGGMSFSQLYGL